MKVIQILQKSMPRIHEFYSNKIREFVALIFFNFNLLRRINPILLSNPIFYYKVIKPVEMFIFASYKF